MIEAVKKDLPASHEEIIAVLRRALDRAYKFPVRSISVAMHMKDGGYYPDDAFPYGDKE